MKMDSWFEGALLVDKPTGMTSHDVVHNVRKILNTSKVGHSGTLDPLGTGLMVILVGRATKLSDCFLNSEKVYEIDVDLTYSTDTYDSQGQVLYRHEGALPSENHIREMAHEIQGELEMAIPAYSAKKVNGKKLYEYARQGQDVPNVTKLMSFQVTSYLPIPFGVRVGLKCSKGTFVRSWAHELGKKLGTGGTVTRLRRLVSDPYSVADAVTLDNLKLNGPQAPYYKPLNQLLDYMETIHVEGVDEGQMRNGKIPPGAWKQAINSSDRFVRIMGSSGDLLSVLERNGSGQITIKCVLS